MPISAGSKVSALVPLPRIEPFGGLPIVQGPVPLPIISALRPGALVEGPFLLIQQAAGGAREVFIDGEPATLNFAPAAGYPGLVDLVVTHDA